jgi:hypothetical protein
MFLTRLVDMGQLEDKDDMAISEHKATSSPSLTENRLNVGHLFKYLHSQNNKYSSRQFYLKNSHFAVSVIVKATYIGWYVFYDLSFW